MITELQTERLKLKKMDVSDSSSLFKIWSDPDVAKFMNINSFNDESQAIEMIEMLDMLYEESKAIRYSIFHLESNQIIGSCGYNSLDFENLKAEIGYEISKEYWGNGFASEAVLTLVNYAFHNLNFNRVEAKIEPDNKNSIKLVERLNFQFEGTLRKSERSKDTFIDLNMYSKLVTD
ncbi:GNAT family protein [Ornithinibacillus sp. FSL M8-0202]|uniref:GNAT family N-acetyltransferase n=1 Tax=Ornithinibacillus sp. FSL M8-0202 TaxID=2921616 RepID=UPI0030D0164D